MYYNIRVVFCLALVMCGHCVKRFAVSRLILKIIFWVDHVRLSHMKLPFL